MAPVSPHLASLTSLGIPKATASYALREFGDAETAADWCFSPEGQSWTPSSFLSLQHTQPPAQEAPPPSRFTSSSLPPPHRTILPGAQVAIILKEDQATGKTVVGEVADVLTRGDHPRGVKVRLRDGRVGRVVGVL